MQKKDLPVFGGSRVFGVAILQSARLCIRGKCIWENSDRLSLTGDNTKDVIWKDY